MWQGVLAALPACLALGAHCLHLHSERNFTQMFAFSIHESKCGFSVRHLELVWQASSPRPDEAYKALGKRACKVMHVGSCSSARSSAFAMTPHVKALVDQSWYRSSAWRRSHRVIPKPSDIVGAYHASSWHQFHKLLSDMLSQFKSSRWQWHTNSGGQIDEFGRVLFLPPKFPCIWYKCQAEKSICRWLHMPGCQME